MENQTRVRWKCRVCGKVVSSKQTAQNHVKVIHPSCDQTVSNILKVNVEVTEKLIKKEKVTSKLKNTPKTKKAVSFSTQLSEAFKDKSLFESFSLNNKKSKQTLDNNTSVSSVRDGVGQSLGQETSRGADDSLPPHDTLPPHGSLPPHDTLPPHGVEKAPQPVLPTLPSRLVTHTTKTVTDHQPDSLDNLIGAQQIDPTALTGHSIFTPVLGSNPKGFRAPFKTRGHCGDVTCSGCNRSSCGTCYNCLHKKEVK